MEKQARMVLLSTSVILAALLFWSWKNRPPEAEQVQAGTASVQDIYNSVTISGTVEAADSTALCPAQTAVVLAGAAVLLVNSEGGKSYPGYAIYAVAAYTFYKIIMSTIQVLKVGKRKSPLLTITRRIGYIDACVSILTLQTAMFASFASGQEDFMLMMNAATGAVVCMMVLGLGIQGLCYYRKQTGGKA